MDENESKILRSEVLEEVLEAAYERADEKFLALSDLLTAGRDDRRLGEVILGTYDKIQAHPDPRGVSRGCTRRAVCARAWTRRTAACSWSRRRRQLWHGMAFLETAIGEVTGVDIVEGAYLPALESDLAQAKALLDALMAHDWDRSVEALAQYLGLPVSARRASSTTRNS